MSRQATIKRYSLILEKINSNQMPSFDELKTFLDDLGFEISKRTLQRDIEQIRNEFGVEIVYNKQSNGYAIDKENSIHIDTFLNFLDIVTTAGVLSDSLNDAKDALHYISFDITSSLKGIEYLSILLKATSSKRLVSFKYIKFYDDETKKHEIQPYLLKSYQNRWYLIGKNLDSEEFRTFGLDRMTNVKMGTQKFIWNKKDNPQELFNNIIGLNYSTDYDVEEVVLSFTPFQGKYVKTLPMHHSQQIIIDNNKELRIRLLVIPNFELTQKILMQADNVKVISPEWYRKEISGIIKNMLKKHQ